MLATLWPCRSKLVLSISVCLGALVLGLSSWQAGLSRACEANQPRQPAGASSVDRGCICMMVGLGVPSRGTS